MIRIESPVVLIGRILTRLAYPELGIGETVQRSVERALATGEASVVVVTLERWGRKVIKEGRLINLGDEQRRGQIGSALSELSVANKQGDPNAVMKAVNDLILGSPSVPLRQGVMRT